MHINKDIVLGTGVKLHITLLQVMRVETSDHGPMLTGLG